MSHLLPDSLILLHSLPGGSSTWISNPIVMTSNPHHHHFPSLCNDNLGILTTSKKLGSTTHTKLSLKTYKPAN